MLIVTINAQVFVMSFYIMNADRFFPEYIRHNSIGPMAAITKLKKLYQFFKWSTFHAD